MEPKRVLIKFGGAAMKNPELADVLFEAVAKLASKGVQITFVHGGGQEIDQMLSRLSIVPRKHNGLRITDRATLEVVEMVLAGKVNKALVSKAQKYGLKALGLSGLDANLATVSKKNEQLGFVGSIESIDTTCLTLLQEKGFFPIVCSIAQDDRGQHMNVNADELAAAMAGSLKVDLFVLVTDVPGLMSKYPDPSSVISNLSLLELDRVLNSNTVAAGMIPKVQACKDAISQGARASLIVNMIYSDLEKFLFNYEQPQGTLIQ